MRKSLIVLILVVGTSLLWPTQASALASVEAVGTFTVDSVQVRDAVPVGSTACLLSADVTLSFHGTLDGGASGPITVLSNAACDQPPVAGDVFLARVIFRGVIAGRAATTRLIYAGHTAPVTGAVAGTMVTAGPVAVLHVSAQAGVGGTYTGVVRLG